MITVSTKTMSDAKRTRYENTFYDLQKDNQTQILIKNS